MRIKQILRDSSLKYFLVGFVVLTGIAFGGYQGISYLRDQQAKPSTEEQKPSGQVAGEVDPADLLAGDTRSEDQKPAESDNKDQAGDQEDNKPEEEKPEGDRVAVLPGELTEGSSIPTTGVTTEPTEADALPKTGPAGDALAVVALIFAASYLAVYSLVSLEAIKVQL